MERADPSIEAAEHIAGLLAAEGLEAIVIGAVALAAHRYIRHTEDVDLAIDADLPRLREMASLLQSGGYHVELHEPDADDPLGGVLDISGAFGLVQVVSFADRFPAVIRDALAGDDVRLRPESPLRLVPLPQLVALKLYAGGLKSRADVVEVLRRNPEADLDQIRETCRRYRLDGFEEIARELEHRSTRI